MKLEIRQHGWERIRVNHLPGQPFGVRKLQPVRKDAGLPRKDRFEESVRVNLLHLLCRRPVQGNGSRTRGFGQKGADSNRRFSSDVYWVSAQDVKGIVMFGAE